MRGSPQGSVSVMHRPGENMRFPGSPTSGSVAPERQEGRSGEQKASGGGVGDRSRALLCWQRRARQIVSPRPVCHLESSLAAVPEVGSGCTGFCASRQQKAVILECRGSARR